jgi:hypothetical protein
MRTATERGIRWMMAHSSITIRSSRGKRILAMVDLVACDIGCYLESWVEPAGGFPAGLAEGRISAEDEGALADVRACEACGPGGATGPIGDELRHRHHFFRVRKAARVIGGQGAHFPKHVGLVGREHKRYRRPFEVHEI